MRRSVLHTLALPLWLAIAAPSASATPVSPSLLQMIELWLVANFDLPPATEPPALVAVPAPRLIEIRYGSTSAVPPGDVVAVYDDASRTIFLTQGWTGRSAAELSVLVHEMVHHMQASAEMRFACPGERELVAYQAQDSWLHLFGTSLETEFGIDRTMLLVATACTH